MSDIRSRGCALPGDDRAIALSAIMPELVGVDASTVGPPKGVAPECLIFPSTIVQLLVEDHNRHAAST